jgi:hypothetical protein
MIIITPNDLSSPMSMKGNREARFSGVFYLVGVGNWARKSADYM